MIDDAQPGTEPIADKFVNDVRAARRDRLKASKTINQGSHKKPSTGWGRRRLGMIRIPLRPSPDSVNKGLGLVTFFLREFLRETSSSSAAHVRVASANAYSGGLSSLEKRYL